MESKFQSLVQRVGASKEDIEAVNSQIASKFKNKPPRESFSNNQKFLSGQDVPTSSNLYGESSGHPTINLVQEFNQEKKKSLQPHKDSAANQKKTKIVEVIDFGGEDTNTAPVNN